MKVQTKRVETCRKCLRIEVTQEAIQEEFDRFYAQLQKTAEVPGFRKGKAPRNILERHFAHKASGDVLNHLVMDSYHNAVEQEKIAPVALPHISNVQFDKGEKLVFEATVDVRPEFSLKSYRGLKLKNKAVSVKEEEIDKILAFLQERYAQFVPVEGRAARIGDYIICDYDYSVNGKVVEKKEHVWLWIDEKLFIPGLSEQLAGINAGEKKEFDLILPDHFHPAELAKKTARFSVFVKEIKEKKLPPLDDAFAKTIGKDSLDNLKKQIREDAAGEKEQSRKADLRAQIIEQLVKAMPVDVPASMLKEREESLRGTARRKLQQQGMSEAQIAREEKQMDEFFVQEARKQIRAFFILEAVAEKEKITVEEEELEKRVETIARSYGQKKEDFAAYLREKELLDNVRWEVWEEKIIAFLLEYAIIEETKG